MKNFRNDSMDKATGKIKNIYNKNINRANHRKHALSGLGKKLSNGLNNVLGNHPEAN